MKSMPFRPLIRTAFLSAIALLLLTVGQASAVPQLTFDQTSSGNLGLVSWAGGGASLVGTDIFFNRVEGVDTPDHAGDFLSCDPICDLNFVTGSHIGFGSGSSEWAGGGTFTLEGTLKDGLDNIIATGLLLSGSWTTPVRAFSGGPSLILVGFGVDTKNADLLAYYGFSPLVEFTSLTSVFGASVTDESLDLTQPFQANVNQADLTNTPVTNAPIPEPGTLLLLGGGLSALALRRRRRRRI